MDRGSRKLSTRHLYAIRTVRPKGLTPAYSLLINFDYRCIFGYSIGHSYASHLRPWILITAIAKVLIHLRYLRSHGKELKYDRRRERVRGWLRRDRRGRDRFRPRQPAALRDRVGARIERSGSERSKEGRWNREGYSISGAGKIRRRKRRNLHPDGRREG